MRNLLIIIAVAILAYCGWAYYYEHRDTLRNSIPLLSQSEEPPPPEPADPNGEPPEGPPPPFVSKVKLPEPPPDAPPNVKVMAPPGFFYVLARHVVEIKSGVVAIVPGDYVKLIQRKNNGILRVSLLNDLADFDVKEEELTQDPEIAQIAEKRDYEKRYHVQLP